jgi:excisionase family DNA binding protein
MLDIDLDNPDAFYHWLRPHITAAGVARYRRYLATTTEIGTGVDCVLTTPGTLAAAMNQRRRQRKPRPPDGLLTMAEAAAKLGCSTKTLNSHVADGELGYVTLGRGKARPRKLFVPADLDAFISAQKRKGTPCPSLESRARHTGTSISKCEVIDFAGPRKPPTGARRKK